MEDVRVHAGRVAGVGALKSALAADDGAEGVAVVAGVLVHGWSVMGQCLGTMHVGHTWDA